MLNSLALSSSQMSQLDGKLGPLLRQAQLVDVHLAEALASCWVSKWAVVLLSSCAESMESNTLQKNDEDKTSILGALLLGNGQATCRCQWESLCVRAPTTESEADHTLSSDTQKPKAPKSEARCPLKPDTLSPKLRVEGGGL